MVQKPRRCPFSSSVLSRHEEEMEREASGEEVERKKKQRAIAQRSGYLSSEQDRMPCTNSKTKKKKKVIQTGECSEES